MKYFSKVLIVLVVAVCVGLFVFSSQYRDHHEKEKITLTTVKIDNSGTTTKKNTRQLIAENKEGGYQLYLGDGTVILYHNGKEKNFDGWYSYVSIKTPQLYYDDYDRDDKKELAVIMENFSTSDFESGDDYSNLVVVVKPTEDVEIDENTVINEDEPFVTYVASFDTWKRPFNQAIRCDMTQLKMNNKYIQLVLENIKNPIEYDEKTGIAKNKFAYYALAEKNGKKSYAEFLRWTRGNTRYTADGEGNLVLEIQVLAYYDGISAPQKIGILKMKIRIYSGAFDIMPGSITFETNDKYYCPDPRESANESWSSVIINSANPVSDTDRDISWVDVEFALSTPYEQTSISFAGMDSQIKNVDRVELTDKGVKLYAKDGYSFSKKPCDKGNYSVTINNGEKTQYDISDTCKVEKEEDVSVLVISFDKAYNRDELKGVKIKYGS